ncbi:hypothetical protein SAMN05421541_10636 [Actinoplanes philippinensis]|uniref:Uncharacterized protein n=1 Tax=Actinoplanes philippinensis TaxID=35752 RepID=A0A1I2FXQ4_9ACTN|nr:hypothetical protein [Actinoplanes philippinensis]SFF10132.1 hypothetical protein SAMN05421541_10636 [Actinoplanes philippinensis]
MAVSRGQPPPSEDRAPAGQGVEAVRPISDAIRVRVSERGVTG